MKIITFKQFKSNYEQYYNEKLTSIKWFEMDEVILIYLTPTNMNLIMIKKQLNCTKTTLRYKGEMTNEKRKRI
jgi:hypothetical protein